MYNIYHGDSILYISIVGEGRRVYFVMPNQIIVPYKFSPRDYQLKLFQALDGVEGRPETRKRRAFLRWHRRSGKDKTCFAYMAKEMVAKPGIYYYFFPTYQQGRMALWEQKDIRQHLPDEVVARANNQEMLMELKNGSVFRIVGTDNIDRIVGTNPIGCVFSEYSLQDPRAWRFISPILAENKGWAVFNGTPRGRNHMYKLEKNVASKRGTWYTSALTVEDTKLIGTLKEEIDEALVTEGQDHVDQEYWVAYSAGARGAIYMRNVELARSQGRIGEFPPNDHLWVDTFWDIGVSDATSIWFRQIDKGRIIWIDYYEGEGQDIAYYVNVLRSKGYKYRTHYLPHDGSQRKMTGTGRLATTSEMFADCCQSAGISNDVVVCPKLPVQDGINGVRKLFSKFYFNEGLCEDGIEKIALYHRRWDPKRETFVKEPVHDWTSHCADALRTCVAAEEYEDRQSAPHQLKVIDDFDVFGG
jgi:hypothetical protein